MREFDQIYRNVYVNTIICSTYINILENLEKEIIHIKSHLAHKVDERIFMKLD